MGRGDRVRQSELCARQHLVLRVVNHRWPPFALVLGVLDFGWAPLTTTGGGFTGRVGCKSVTINRCAITLKRKHVVLEQAISMGSNLVTSSLGPTAGFKNFALHALLSNWVFFTIIPCVTIPYGLRSPDPTFPVSFYDVASCSGNSETFLETRTWNSANPLGDLLLINRH